MKENFCCRLYTIVYTLVALQHCEFLAASIVEKEKYDSTNQEDSFPN